MVGESIVWFCSGWLEPSLPSAQLPVNVSPPLVGTLAGRGQRREHQYTFAADGRYNKVWHLVLYLYYTLTPDGGYNKVKTLVGQAGEVWRTVLVVFGRNNGFTGRGRRSSASLKTRVEKDNAARSCAMTRYAPLHSTCLLGERLKKRGKEHRHQTVYCCVKTCSTWSTNGLLLC